MPRSVVTIDVAIIPEAVSRRLARETLSAVKRFIEQPGGKEILEAKIAEFHAGGGTNS